MITLTLETFMIIYSKKKVTNHFHFSLQINSKARNVME